MWIADVGRGLGRSELRTLATSGGINYSWRAVTKNDAAYNTSGCLPQSSYIAPIFVYPHNSATGGFSTGGHVYRGSEYAAMVGYYICADYVSGNTWLIKSNGASGWNTTQQNGLPGNISGFGERRTVIFMPYPAMAHCIK